MQGSNGNIFQRFETITRIFFSAIQNNIDPVANLQPPIVNLTRILKKKTKSISIGTYTLAQMSIGITYACIRKFTIDQFQSLRGLSKYYNPSIPLESKFFTMNIRYAGTL